jgi:amino acid adenylation domain-containing protein
LSRKIRISERNELLALGADRPTEKGANELGAAGSGSVDNSAEDRSKHFEYWRRQLAGEVPRLQLPFDRARPSKESHQSTVERFELPANLTQGLKRLGEASGCSLYVTVLTGVAVLLQRYSGQEEMMIGGSISDASSNSENPFALRIDLSSDPNFLDLQSRVGVVFLDATAHAGVPFSEVVKEIRPGHELSGNPFFNVAVSHFPLGAAAEVSTGSLMEDLKFSFEDRGEQLCGAITYATDLFDRTTITEMVQHWQNLLSGACEGPAKRVSELRILSANERIRIVHEWNDTRAAYPIQCVHELFERQAAKTPDLTAVVHQGKTLSYRELNERANQVAHYLRKRGVGPETLVGVCLNRTPEMVIGLLGIWKAGGAYVPLDPAYPQDRLSYMMKDSAAKCLLTSGELKRLFPSATDKTILLDADWNLIASESSANPEPVAVPSNLAYVMYTSGSTGEPKGAMILHSGLANYLTWAIRTYAVEEGGSVPVHSSISFDLTVTSMYPALLAGGSVELLPEDVGARSLLGALRRGGRNLVKITPAHLELLSQEIKPSEAAAMTKVFVIGGENLLAESLRLWRDFAPETRLINEYGPTETVVGCCIYEVRAEDPRSGSVIIGRPIANTQLYILDRHRNPVPAGVAGELYIGGDGVARGYLNRPELTQQQFLPDPCSGREGALLYRTGDLARYRKDGNLEFLGRIDSQVKVRGYRIELGEIEAALMEHPRVKMCAVLAREDEPGDKQLVAYAILEDGINLAAEELRQSLQRKLPKYMVPSQCVLLESFPLTTNGKVDRKALPAPGLRRAEVSEVAVAAESFEAPLAEAASGKGIFTRERMRPQTETEKALVAIWTEVLRVENPGVNDDFFDLGGHSLLAIKITSRIRDVFDVDLATQSVFEHPTIAGLAGVLADSKNAGGSVQHIERRTAAGPTALSFAQEQLWFLNQLAPSSPVYNVVDVIRFDGQYNADAIKKSLDELVRRHEVLRTTFFYGDGRPMQTVLPGIDLAFKEIDLDSFASEEREREWKRVVQEEGRKPFDLSQAPLFRAAMVHVSGQEQELLLTIHHIIADEWSMELIHDEIIQLYDAFSHGRPSPLSELPIQYADFSVWQRNWLEGEVLERQESYWKKELSGAPTVLELPTDKPRLAAQTFRGAIESFKLPKDLSEQLKSLSREEHATLFMLLEAGFATLLHRYTGQEDILVGTPISGRTRSETERLVGYFLNTVVLRAQFSERMNFRALLQQVREKALGAYAHPDLPFDRLVADLAPERDPSRSPVYQVMFVLHNPDGVSEVSTASGNRELSTGTSKFDLTLVLSETKDGLEGMIEYNTDLFAPASIRRMCGHYQKLLEAIAEDPEQSISKLTMLTSAEREQVLVGWNQTGADYAGMDRCLHELIADQAARTPDQVALVFEQKRLTYGELNRRANQLARHLQGLGVGPEILVGLYVDRSLEMIVGLLGILKAGGAYVPMDPAYPKERIGYILEDSKAPIVLTQKSLAHELPEFTGQPVCLDSDWAQIATQAEENPVSQAKPENLAYVLFTSGSTGRPKGVALEHRCAVSFVQWGKQVFTSKELEGVLFSTSMCFDLSVFEMFVTLSAGGKIIIAPDVLHLPNLPAKNEITLINTVPSAISELLRVGGVPDSVKTINLAGEPLSDSLAAQIYASTRVEHVYNLYGPTETTTYSTYTLVPRGGAVTVGKPIANTQVYIVDANRKPVPIGVPGELFIAGAGVARGYYGRPDLTSERFVPNPFSGRTGARMYRTGDVCNWLPDGDIRYVGRADHQVKLRGFRIELGEIEAAMERHPAVRKAFAMVREDKPGLKRLVAYFETKKESAQPEAGDLREHLKKALPEYMVPSNYIPLERLPLTPNGKIDRKALPAPDDQAAPGAPDSVAPRDAIEQMLSQIWAKVLNVKRIGLHDNFFDLGGHSLLAVRIVADVEKMFGTRLPLATLLQAPTIAELAEILRKENWTPPWSSLIPLRPGGSKPPLFLMHSHGGNVIEYYALANQLDSDQPVYALQARGLDGKIVKGRSMEEVAASYVEEIRSFQPEGPYYLGGFCLGGSIALAAAQQLTTAGQEVALVILIQSTHPDAIGFKPETTRIQRIRYSAQKRIDLEMENLSYRGWKYIVERGRHLWNRAGARAAMLLDRLAEKEIDAPSPEGEGFTTIPERDSKEPSKLPMNYILEVLGVEHERALHQFVPTPYGGDVILFRASKQLVGQNVDEVLGWKEVLTGHLDVCEIPGHQQNMMSLPNVLRLGKEITCRLITAQKRREEKVPAAV